MALAQSWTGAHPREAAGWLAALEAPWWVAGGWALDLYAGATSRPHGDLDLGVFRDDVAAVIAALPGWEFFASSGGARSRLAHGALPDAAVHSVWCRPAGAQSWSFELMLDERADDCWVFRRQPRIRRTLAAALCRSEQDLPYLAPEIQLLYKAKDVRGRDQADFDRTAPRLPCEARSWLRQSLMDWQPDHPWIGALAT